jgi:dTDP-4-dehydrorhamnose 3,5-epimerase
VKFVETNVKDVWVIELNEIADSRGFFARSFCGKEFEQHGLKATVAQANLSYNHKKGTLRGMHYSARPVTETKLVRCTAGAIYDCIVDVRPESPTYLQHFGIELTAQNRKALYVPEMFAHGYLTLTDGAEVVYQVGDFYQPGYERGVRYDDPAFGITWPVPIEVISEKDTKWAPFKAE